MLLFKVLCLILLSCYSEARLLKHSFAQRKHSKSTGSKFSGLCDKFEFLTQNVNYTALTFHARHFFANLL